MKTRKVPLMMFNCHKCYGLGYILRRDSDYVITGYCDCVKGQLKELRDNMAKAASTADALGCNLTDGEIWELIGK